MQVTFTLSGLPEMLRRLRTLSGELQGRILESAVLAGARVIRDRASQLAPRGTNPRTRVKYNRKPISQDIVVALNRETLIGSRVEAKIGPSKRQFHGIFLEYGRRARAAAASREDRRFKPGWNTKGTKFRTRTRLTKADRAVSAMAPRPFLGPALASSANEALEAAARNIKKSLDSLKLV
ncbi:MAG TPA: HK97-gp10 family putative phage morphogenesis protein [Thermoanaerobaculia bacterium]|nr:HK97-gp10 family putative phage morphogenesis protein [Thermoanaerobaculia bacterium]